MGNKPIIISVDSRRETCDRRNRPDSFRLSLPRPPTPATSCCRYVFQSSMCMTLSSWMPGGDVGFQPTSSPDTSAGLFGCDCLRLELDAQRLRDAGTVGRIRLGAVADVPLLDVEFCVAHCTRRVLEQQLLLRRRHLPEQISRLFPMIVVDAVVPVRCFPFERERRLGKIRLVVPEPRAVGIVGERSAQIAVGPHLAVAMVALERALWGVNRNVVEVDAKP